MSSLKKAPKSKFIAEEINEFMNNTQYLKDSPKNKKISKRQRPEPIEEEQDIAKLIGQYQVSAKKKKLESNVEACKESRQKVLDVMGHQLESRKQGNENLLKSLSVVVNDLEADYNAMKDNEQKLEHLTGSLIKCIQQATSAHKQKLKALKEIHASYKKECEDMESNHKADTDKLANELEEDIKKLQQKLVSETKRNGWETLRRTIFHAMQNDI